MLPKDEGNGPMKLMLQTSKISTTRMGDCGILFLSPKLPVL